MKDIVFCINESWAMPAGILIQSILHYNPGLNVTFHIVTKAFSEKKQQELFSVISGNDAARIIFHFVDESSLKNLPLRKNDHVTIETYFRFLIPALLPEDIHSVLYLDCDMLCTGSLEELLSIDISGYSAGMCPDTRFSDIEVFNRLDYPMQYGYYCAGTILMNLDWWRKKKISEQCVSFLSENPGLCLWHDQDAINKVLHESILPLNARYNVLPGLYTLYDFTAGHYTKSNSHNVYIEKKQWNDIISGIEDARIVHFSGRIKPWHTYDTLKPFMLLWRRFYKESQWANQKYAKNPLPLKTRIKHFLKKLIKGNGKPYPDKAYAPERRLLNAN